MTIISKDPLRLHLIQTFNNIFRYLDDILALNNDDFSMYSKEICSVYLTLNEANTYNEHCPFLKLDIYIINRKLNTNIYDERDDFSFPTNYLCLDGDVVKLVKFAGVCNNLFNFSERNLCFTEKLLHQDFPSQTSQNIY